MKTSKKLTCGASSPRRHQPKKATRCHTVAKKRFQDGCQAFFSFFSFASVAFPLPVALLAAILPFLLAFALGLLVGFCQFA